MRQLVERPLFLLGLGLEDWGDELKDWCNHGATTPQEPADARAPQHRAPADHTQTGRHPPKRTCGNRLLVSEGLGTYP